MAKAVEHAEDADPMDRSFVDMDFIFADHASGRSLKT